MYGNITMIIANVNLYQVDLAGMDIQGTIGKNVSNQLRFNQTIGEVSIPASSGSTHLLPVDIVFPPEINALALFLEMAQDCLDNSLTTIMAGAAKVKVLGAIIPFSFGPQEFESPCIGN